MRITLTGPRSVGKSTTGVLLAESLGYEYLSGDDIMDELLQPYGGLSKVLRDKRKDIINTHVVEKCKRALAKDKVVFDLAGGSLTIEDKTIVDEMKRIILEKSLVIGLLPSMNDSQAVDVLYNRERKRAHFYYLSDDELLEKVKRNYRDVKEEVKKLTKHIVYTGILSPKKVVDRCTSFL